MLKDEGTNESLIHSREESEPEKVTQETNRNEEAPLEEAKGLSRRDALEVAVEALKPATEKPNEQPKADSVRRGKDDKGRFTKAPAGDAKGNAEPAKGDGAAKGLEPPAEYTAEEKADFAQLSAVGQAAQIRLHKARQSKLGEIQAAAREFEHAKKLAESVNPYIKAMGIKDQPEVALQKALKMWREFEDGDPKAAAAAYLKAKGIEIPKEWASDPKAAPVEDPKIASVQAELNLLKNRLAQEDHARLSQVASSTWLSLAEEKNASGKVKYPDMSDNSDAGLKRASQIASLVNGVSEISKQFIANAKERIPNLDYPTLIKEAYRFYGGKVDDSEAPRTTTTQQHIAQSRRAAASVPGRGASIPSGDSKKLPRREALAQALAEIRERESA